MAGSPGINTSPVTPETPDIARRAAQALQDEVWLTPKPGLVDSANNGAHRDMDLALFLRSITAITPWLEHFTAQGRQHALRPASEQLCTLRPVGIACEQAMFAATNGVNTHKGGIFSLGLLCCAAGRLQGQNLPLTRYNLCREVSAMCLGLVMRELHASHKHTTQGEKLFARYGLTGARGEAESGFLTVRRFVLPYWHQETHPQRRLLAALLRLMAHNPDTNLVSRGGVSGLRYVQRYALRLLQQGWDIAALQEMDNQLIARNLSPGGSADLLAVSAILASFPDN